MRTLPPLHTLSFLSFFFIKKKNNSFLVNVSMLLDLFDQQKNWKKKRVLVEKANAIINHLQPFSMLLACPLSDPPHIQLAADALSCNKILPRLWLI